MHDDVAEFGVTSVQGNLVGVYQDKLTLDRVPAIVIGADAHKTAERRILGERF